MNSPVRPFKSISAFADVWLLGWPGIQPVDAQSRIFPSVQLAVQNCYLTAQAVTGGYQPVWRDTEPCTEALDLELNPRERAATLVNLGLIEVQLGDFEEARKNFDLAISIADDYADAFLNRANLQYLRRDFAGAVRDYSEALRLDSAVADIIYLNRGMAYQNLEEFDLAEMDYRAALSVRPQWALVAEKLQNLEGERQSAAFPQ